MVLSFFLAGFILFFIGTFFGSFFNVVADRLKNGESIILGRSHCEYCKKELEWEDLIPLISFIILKGRCRYCHKKLSFFYPVSEIITGILFACVFVFVFYPGQAGFSDAPYFKIASFLYYIFIVSSFIIIFLEDLKYGIIPDKVLFPAILISLIYLYINPQFMILNVISGLGAFMFFLLLFVFTGGKGMGFGDVKLAFLLGLVLGFPKILLSLYLAFLTGAIIGLILILWRKKASIKDAIPFAPFLITGSVITLFLGDLIITKIMVYLGLL